MNNLDIVERSAVLVDHTRDGHPSEATGSRRLISSAQIQSLAVVGIPLLFLVISFFMIKHVPTSWNDESRVAAIQSLVERGTWSIDDSEWNSITKDKVFIGGRFYSDKMPLLSLMGAGVYSLLRNTVGGSLAPNCAAIGQTCAYFWVTFLLITIPGVLMLFLFATLAVNRGVPAGINLLATGALGFGTMVLPYAQVLNHHLPSAVCLFAAFFILTVSHSQSKYLVAWMFLAGMLSAAAPSFDLLAGLITVGLLVYAVIRFRLVAFFFVLGAIPSIIVSLWINLQIGHSILPPYLVPHAYSFPGSVISDSPGGLLPPSDLIRYTFQMFVGTRGLFQFNPLLLFAIAGLITALRNRQWDSWKPTIGLVPFLVLFFAYPAVGTSVYGGASYGERYFVAALPILFSFIFLTSPLKNKAWRSPYGVAFMGLLLISVYSSFQGAQSPWTTWPPPLLQPLIYFKLFPA